MPEIFLNLQIVFLALLGEFFNVMFFEFSGPVTLRAIKFVIFVDCPKIALPHETADSGSFPVFLLVKFVSRSSRSS